MTIPSELAELLSALVRIDSVNPSLVPGGAGEREIAAFVAAWLTDRGVEAVVEETATPGRPNCVARRTGSGRTILLNVHTDTVGVAGMAEPFSGRIDGGKLYGRGSADTKAGLATAMWTIVNTPSNVVLTAVADEEWGSVGTEAVAGRFNADLAVVLEPTGLRIGTSHRGFVAIEVEVPGRAAHGSLPHEGIDAIARAGRFLTALEDHAAALLASDPHPLLGPPSVHASLISGGQEWSSYPERCLIQIERRTLPGETPEDVRAEIAALAAPSLRADVRYNFHRDPLAAGDESVARDVAGAFERVLGRRPDIGGLPYWTDAALLAAAGTPAIVFGPSGQGIHGTEEWVDLDSVWQCAQVLREICA